MRRWRAADVEPFAALNADPMVMEFFPHTRSLDETRRLVDQFEAQFDEQGFGLWAVATLRGKIFVGMVGLAVMAPDWPLEGTVEVGWRLAPDHWGNGYATEAARASVQFAFNEVGVEEVIALTAVDNARSRRVMEEDLLAAGIGGDSPVTAAPWETASARRHRGRRGKSVLARDQDAGPRGRHPT